jgi:hypothetical protein
MSDGNEPEHCCHYLLEIYVRIQNLRLLIDIHTGFDT